MKEIIKKSGWSMVVAVISILSTVYYIHYSEMESAKSYISYYEKLGGGQLVLEITDTYKEMMELFSNYKLNKDAKKKLADHLEELSKKLQRVDIQLHSGERPVHLDFSYIYQDVKLVNISLSDPTKEDVIPVIVLHAMEGIGELKKQIVTIEARN